MANISIVYNIGRRVNRLGFVWARTRFNYKSVLVQRHLYRSWISRISGEFPRRGSSEEFEREARSSLSLSFSLLLLLLHACTRRESASSHKMRCIIDDSCDSKRNFAYDSVNVIEGIEILLLLVRVRRWARVKSLRRPWTGAGRREKKKKRKEKYPKLEERAIKIKFISREPSKVSR